MMAAVQPYICGGISKTVNLPNRASIEALIDYALEQKLMPRRLSVDELFVDTVKRLGVEPFKERVYATR